MFTTAITISLWIAAFVLGILAISVWRQSYVARPLALSVVVLLIGATLWVVAYLVELYTFDPLLKFIAYRTKFLGIVIAPVGWFTFAVQYVGRDRWLSRRNIVLLGIIPALTTILLWTNEWHHWMWTRNTIVGVNNFQVIVSDPAFWFWIHFTYSYLAVTAGTLLLVRRFTEIKGPYRRQLTVLLISVAFPYISILASIFGFGPLDLGPIAFSITGIALAWGYLQYQLFDLVPVARHVVIDSMTDGMIVLDLQERIVDVNPAARSTFALSSTQLIGKPLAEVVGPLAQRRDLLEQYRAADFTSGELMIVENQMTRYVDVRVSALYDQHEHVNGRVVVFRDITEQKQAEYQIRIQNEALVQSNRDLDIARQKAEEADQLKSQFLATMSHELRTPLNAIIGYSEVQLMGMTGTLSEEQRNYQERILVNAEHLLGLINGVLDLTKIEAGRVELVPNPFSLQQWLDDIILQNQVLADEKGLRLESYIDPALPDTITGDATRLKQIVINLLSNAIKFTEAGFVRVELCMSNDRKWQIVVSDSGMGIPTHAQDAIFDEFWQVDSSPQRARSGTGLGLSIVRKLVLLMGGTIQVKSDLGKGSTFTATFSPLPLVEPALSV